MLVIKQLCQEISGLWRYDHFSIVVFGHFIKALEPVNVSAGMHGENCFVGCLDDFITYLL